MTLFGHAISITLMLQLAATCLILAIYAISDVFREGEADRASNRQTILLADFLLRHHPQVTSLAILLERNRSGDSDGPEKITETTDMKVFLADFGNYMREGLFPPPTPAIVRKPYIMLIPLAFAPFSAILGFIMQISRHRRREFRILHTAWRKNAASGISALLFVNLLIGFLLAEFLYPHHPVQCLIYAALPVMGIVLCLALLAMLAREQLLWKSYWTGKLLEVMAVAAYSRDHDLFNRALFLKNDVASEPDLPLPSKLSVYTTIYSVVQIVILYSSRALHFG